METTQAKSKLWLRLCHCPVKPPNRRKSPTNSRPKAYVERFARSSYQISSDTFMLTGFDYNMETIPLICFFDPLATLPGPSYPDGCYSLRNLIRNFILADTMHRKIGIRHGSIRANRSQVDPNHVDSLRPFVMSTRKDRPEMVMATFEKYNTGFRIRMLVHCERGYGFRVVKVRVRPQELEVAEMPVDDVYNSARNFYRWTSWRCFKLNRTSTEILSRARKRLEDDPNPQDVAAREATKGIQCSISSMGWI
jgi:hypothetical protein